MSWKIYRNRSVQEEFWSAVELGQTSLVASLIKQGADPNAFNNSGFSPRRIL
jgi:hypothetical protein